MRPASLVLLTIGVGLLLGGVAVASFKIPCREEVITYGVYGGPFVRMRCNVWGQPLWAFFTTDYQTGPSGSLEVSTTEDGPYPNSVRQGKWRRVIRKSGKPDVTSDIWYLDGFEVSAAEWEQRQ